MVAENDLKKLIEQVMEEMTSKKAVSTVENKVQKSSQSENFRIEEDKIVPDITEIDIKNNLLVKNPADKEKYLKMKAHTSARLGIGKAGARYKTETMMRFRADHASAQDAVFTDVDKDILKELNLDVIKTKCNDKDEFLTRPDLGRQITRDELDKLKEYPKNLQVQIYISDGLSSKAVEANAKDVLPSVIQGLKGYEISVGTPFFVKFGRVGAMDVISEEMKADVTCVLIGERPGLVTAESMSAYIAYKGTVGMPESRRTVVSNIHKGGTPPVEAGAYIADIIKLMIEKKASGLDLKL